ncbi:MAG: hypothetical protein KQH83_10265 [Actinobacteria bacterium]|nr:hypothetical protein [Actinomycetota bacterium]
MKRSMRIGTLAAAFAGAIVAVAWLIKDRVVGAGPAPVEPAPVAPVPAPPAPAPAASAGDDDLSAIDGIGPVYKARLADAGITTFAALGKADATALAEKIEAPVSRIQAWIDAARRHG